MLQAWIFMAVVLGQSSQPAIPPMDAVAANPPAEVHRSPSISVAEVEPPPPPSMHPEHRPHAPGRPMPVAERPTATAPADVPGVDVQAMLGIPATQPAGEMPPSPAATIGTLGDLTGNPITIEATPDGNIAVVGDPHDVAIIEALIQEMDRQGLPMTFQIFRLQNSQAAELAPKIEQFWNTAKKPATGSPRPEDKITIIPEARANVLMVAATESTMTQITDVIKQLDIPSLGAAVVFTPIQLKHIKAAEAEETLKSMMKSLQEKRNVAKSLFDIQAVARTNTLLISAPEADMEQIKHLISLIDVEPTVEGGGVVKLALYPLKKAVAKELAQSLNDMLTQSDQAKAIKEQIRRLQVISQSTDGAKPIADLNLEKPIKVLPEAGTNSLIVATIEQNLEPLGAIIELLDNVPAGEEIIVKIFPLEHADVEALLTNLKDVFDQGKRLPEEPGKTIPGKVPTGLPGAALAKNIDLSADKRTNTLIVAGRAEQVLLAQQIVKAVDVAANVNHNPARLVKLEHAAAKTVQTALKEIADQRQKVAEATLSKQGAERERILLIADERTNSVIIVAQEQAYEELAKLAVSLDCMDQQFLGQIRIIKLENLAASDIASKIDDLWKRRSELRLKGGLPEDNPAIVVDTRSNSLIVASSKDDFETITDLVKRLETQELSPMSEIRLVQLQYNDPTKVADMIKKLWDERLKNSQVKGQEEQPWQRLAIVEDSLSKTLLIASTKSSYDEVVELIKKLDVLPSVEGLFKIFVIQNADVSKTATQLRDLFDKGLYRGSGSTKNLPESETKVTIIEDMRSSSLIVSASPTNIAIAENLLKQIDRVDVPAGQAAFRIYSLTNADAVNVTDQLTQILEAMGKASGKDGSDQYQVKVLASTRGNQVIVTGTRMAIQRVDELIPKLDIAPGESTVVTKVYEMHEGAASTIEPILTKLFEKAAGSGAKKSDLIIQADDGSNSLVITASKDDHVSAAEVIKMLDRKSNLAEQMRVFPLAHAKAESISDMLDEIIKSQQGDKKGGFSVAPETRTNSLLVWAAPDMMANIESIISRLDNTDTKTPMSMRVFKLRNAKAEDLSELLDNFFEKAGASSGGDSKSARQLIIKFAHVDPKTGAEMIQSLVQQDITIEADKNTNSLMVLAPEEHINMVQQLVEMLDSVEPVTAEIQVFMLHNADATEMADLLKELFEAQSKDSSQRQLVFAGGLEGAGGAGGAGGVGGMTSSGGSGGLMELAFSVDTRTNALIAAGSPSYLKIVERLVYQLDYQEIEDRMVRVIHLRNAKADEVATTMQAYFESEQSALEKAEKGTAALRQIQRQVTIEGGGETSNTLLLSYSPRMESQIVNMINELDRPPPQVMIQVLMAEVTLNDSFEMGMEFALQDLVFSEKATTGANDTLQGPGFDKVFGTNLGASGTSGNGISFTITGEDFNFLVKALQTQGRLEVLSRPAIMVRDNQEANITVGERVPTVQDVVVSSGGVVTPSVSYEKVGVILTVTPIINPDGYVNLDIKPEISAIGTSSVTISSGVTLPTFTERSAETQVTVKDGETIIIGGLITNNTNTSETKVPLAGDVPILGNLFRASQRDNTKTELLIVLTPHVIRTAEEAHTMSVQMRDQTGMMDEARCNPLMNGLQVRPTEDQMGDDLLAPHDNDNSDIGEPMGPMIESYGPTNSGIQTESSALTIGSTQAVTASVQ